VFDKTERGFFAGNDVAGVVQALQRGLYDEEISLEQTAPAIWSGKSARTSWSIRPRVTVVAAPTPRGFMLEVRVSADIESGAILMVVCWFFCFPLAILLAILAHGDFARRRTDAFARMLGEVRQSMIEPNFAHPLAGFPPPYAR
jgi:hypothetical protein